MLVAVYLPLLCPVLAALAARRVADRVEPRLATWLLTVGSVGLAAACVLALAVLAGEGVARLPAVAALGHYPVAALGPAGPATGWIAVGAGLTLGAMAVAVGRALGRQTRSLRAAARTAAALPRSGEPGARDVVIMDDPAPEAFALPTLVGARAGGTVVVSTGMLAALGPAERAALLAHERAHLAARHHLFVAATQLAAAANPLLRPLVGAVRYTVERWADENAAANCGDRRGVARAVGRAALAGAAVARVGASLGLALGIGRHGSPDAGGPVPRRVAALLRPRPRPRAWPLAAGLALVLGAALCGLEAAHDLHGLIEFAQTR